MIFDVKIEKRENFDAMIEREIISTQNIDFLDVANDENIFFDVDTDITNEIKKSELSMIDSEWLTDDVNINVDSFRDKNVAKNFDFAIDTMNVRFAIIVFDVKRNVDFANSFDVNFAISFANFVNFWWWFWIC